MMMPRLLFVFLASCCPCVVSQLLAIQPAAFSGAECFGIIRLFDEMERQEDDRQNPLLPGMPGTFGVSRANRFDDGSLRDAVQLIIARILGSQALNATLTALTPPGATSSADRFSSELIDFTLLHEFEADVHTKGFDWHVDSKPGDATGRTLNLNVMLSSPASDFVGGDLQVGEATLAPQQGDAYIYPAAIPHRVGPLQSGRRYTLVIALTERRSLDAAAAGSDGHGGGQQHHSVYAERRRVHWEAMDAVFTRVVSGALKHEAKVHILFGEHLEAQGRHTEAQAAFCKSYRATGHATRHAEPATRRTAAGQEEVGEVEEETDAVSGTSTAARAYAADFYASGVQALGMGGEAAPGTPPDLNLAENYLTMAACVDPGHSEAAEALGVVRDAKRIREQQQSSSRPGD